MNLKEFYKRIFTSLILLPVSLFLIIYNQYLFLLFIAITLIFSLIEWFKLNIKFKISFLTLTGYLFLLNSFYLSYLLRGSSYESVLIFLWIILISIFSDIGGYVFGNIFGGLKLTKISPKKTISGSIGSFLFSLFPILIYQFLNIKFIEINLKFILLSLFLCSINQIGDLTISYIKRLRKIKDTGKLLPGHGGILDRIDGIIFVVPVFYLINYFKLS